MMSVVFIEFKVCPRVEVLVHSRVVWDYAKDSRTAIKIMAAGDMQMVIYRFYYFGNVIVPLFAKRRRTLTSEAPFDNGCRMRFFCSVASCSLIVFIRYGIRVNRAISSFNVSCFKSKILLIPLTVRG
jgi:hypothetical protein